MPSRNLTSRRRRKVELKIQYEKCMTVFAREVERLMDLSYDKAMTPADGRLLLEYTKFVADLKALHDAEEAERAKEAPGYATGAKFADKMGRISLESVKKAKEKL